ncbi:MAG TPA: DegT/DnrJ/EryC1/StrS aminotransferase family protein [Burkholderiales bacterium]|nr:DegT/DnrJ/EryC1/StrS aminotransferase family protein [Burkholderiales bacterium]
MTTSRIYYSKPSITPLEVGYATQAAEHGWGEACYDWLERFEQRFREHLGVRHAIATSSATGALHMGLAALGVSPTDEVILADINWIATVAPIVHLAARPRFVDIDADSWCIDPDAVEAAITPRTKAIIATHLYGNVCAMERLLGIGRKHGIPVVEDAAEAIGSVYHNKRVGSMGSFGVFSFHGSKTMTTGEGGMFVTNDDALYESVLTLSHHGRRRGQTRQFWSDVVGFKYRMSNIQAAIGCAQLERLQELLERKRDIFLQYRQRLQHLPLRMNPEPAGTVNGYWMPTIVVNEDVPFEREALLAEFKKNEIDGRVFFWPLSMMPMFEATAALPPMARRVALRGMNLPSYHDLSDAELARVCDVVTSVLRGTSGSRPAAARL